MIELTNGKWTSLLLKKFTCSPISKLLIPSFSRVYQINKEEMEKPLEEYKCLHDFFIRKLKPGVRPRHFKAHSIVSPVDAVIHDKGKIRSDHTIFVKDKVYSILEMIGKEEILNKYIDGTFMVFYLSPSHYHRIHSPISGKIKDQWTLGANSYPVNQIGLKYGKAPLSKNFRIVTEIEQDGASLSIVKIGAMFINSIELTYSENMLRIGEEMAYFSFGSTVVLLFEKDKFQLEPFKLPYHVKVGEVIGWSN